jgi:hypothetical protein
MINVRSENNRIIPYISYFHASFAETRNSIRVAWLTPDENGNITVRHGTDENDRFTGAWEIMTVPAQTVPLTDEFVSHGVPESSAVWTANLPTGSSLKYTGIDKSILVGYMTTDWYEGALLKKSIY